MARPLKKGLGYFPLDTDLLSNRKIQRLTRQYGCTGLSIYLAVLCEIYRTNGYYIPYHEDFCFDIAFTLTLDEKTVDKVIRFCVEIKLFDAALLETRGVLTSFGIQQRFLEICKRNVIRLDPDLEIVSENGLTAPLSVQSGSKGDRNALAHTETAPKGTKPVQPVPGKTSRKAATPVSAAETPVLATETPSKGKGNKKETTTQHGNTSETRSENDHGEAARRAELLRMAAAATSRR